MSFLKRLVQAVASAAPCVFVFSGAGLACVGVIMISVPVGMIVSGVIITGFGILLIKGGNGDE